MNGIEKIIARIQEDSAAEVSAIEARSAQDCADLRARFDKAAEAEYQRLYAAGAEACAQTKARRAGSAATEAKKAILALKQEMVDAAFARAGEMLCALPDKEYAAFLGRLAGEASATGLEELVLNAADRDSRGKAILSAANAACKAKGLPGKLTISKETRALQGGFILKCGDIETNCSIEELTARQRDTLAAQTAAVMFDK